MDRVRAIKFESPATGGGTIDRYYRPAKPNEDAPDLRGVYLQNNTSNDAGVYITRDASSNLVFRDGVLGVEKTLSQILAGSTTTASSISVTPGNGLAATNVQAALNELQGDINGLGTHSAPYSESLGTAGYYHYRNVVEYQQAANGYGALVIETMIPGVNVGSGSSVAFRFVIEGTSDSNSQMHLEVVFTAHLNFAGSTFFYSKGTASATAYQPKVYACRNTITNKIAIILGGTGDLQQGVKIRISDLTIAGSPAMDTTGWFSGWTAAVVGSTANYTNLCEIRPFNAALLGMIYASGAASGQAQYDNSTGYYLDSTRFEVKQGSAVGLTSEEGSNYSAMMTVSPAIVDVDNSRGARHQLYFGNYGLYWRRGYGSAYEPGGGWWAWGKIWTQNDFNPSNYPGRSEVGMLAGYTYDSGYGNPITFDRPLTELADEQGWGSEGWHVRVHLVGDPAIAYDFNVIAQEPHFDGEMSVRLMGTRADLLNDSGGGQVISGMGPLPTTDDVVLYEDGFIQVIILGELSGSPLCLRIVNVLDGPATYSFRLLNMAYQY